MTFEIMEQRRRAARARMRTLRLDALLITNPENRRYLTGFAGHDDGLDSAGRVILTADRILLLTDSRYTEQAVEESPGVEVIDRRDELSVTVRQMLEKLGWTSTGPRRKALGIEADHLTVRLANDLTAAGKDLFRVKPTRFVIEPLRAVKDADEIAATRRATEITGETFMHLLDFMRQPGLTEQDVAAEITATYLRLGADGLAFSSIVACGPNGARPHAVPGNRPLLPEQPIVIDMGARYQGYCADMTRTVFIGDVPKVWRDRYTHVLKAQEACERGLHAGISGKAADALARDVLAKAKLGDYFTHGLGHGTGLEIHEDPRLSPRALESEVLLSGHIVTIEPGVYFPGEGGIRIEDAAVITDDGCDILTTAPKDLDAMVIQSRMQVR
jgi:Xaa-Pro aminopeptidase